MLVVSFLLILICSGLAVNTGWNLNQALDLEQEFQAQINDYSLQASTTSNGLLSSLATVGANAEAIALSRAQEKAREYKEELVAEVLGIVLGVLLIRRRRTNR